jgi:hypothetical protein
MIVTGPGLETHFVLKGSDARAAAHSQAEYLLADHLTRHEIRDQKTNHWQE